MDKNVFSPPTDTIGIHMAYSKYPGDYSLKVYNSSGEHTKTMDSQNMTGILNAYYQWDGKNKYGDVCASGICIFYLTESFSRKMKQVLLIH